VTSESASTAESARAATDATDQANNHKRWHSMQYRYFEVPLGGIDAANAPCLTVGVMPHLPQTSVMGRNLLVFEALATGFRLNLKELCARTGLAKATTHRVLAGLVCAGLVAKDGGFGEYRLTGALARIGRMVDDRVLVLDAIVEAAQAMTLRRSWPVAVGFLEHGKMVVTFSTRKMTTQTLKPSTLYERLDLSSAMGQAALASMSTERLTSELDDLEEFQAGTTARAELEQKVFGARSRGYGLRMTGRAGTSSVAVGLNFGGRTIGAVVATVFQKVASQELIRLLANDLNDVRDETGRKYRAFLS